MPTQKIPAQSTHIADTFSQDAAVRDTSVQNIKSPWHPAFCAAVQLELETNLDQLELHTEHCLGKEPMRIDFLIIKKDSDLMIPKNFGQIFRTYNLISYKSPDDYLSVNDFYKAYGYACFSRPTPRKSVKSIRKRLHLHMCVTTIRRRCWSTSGRSGIHTQRNGNPESMIYQAIPS